MVHDVDTLKRVDWRNMIPSSSQDLDGRLYRDCTAFSRILQAPSRAQSCSLKRLEGKTLPVVLRLVFKLLISQTCLNK